MAQKNRSNRRYKKQIGKLLTLYRMLKNYSRQKTASKAGIPERVYESYESGEANMKVDILIKIAYILNLPPVKIFDEKRIGSYITETGTFISEHRELLEHLNKRPVLHKIIRLYCESPENSDMRKLILKIPYITKEKYDKVMKILEKY